jgi:hypothetical protein
MLISKDIFLILTLLLSFPFLSHSQYACTSADYISALPHSASNLSTVAIANNDASSFCLQNDTNFDFYYIFQYSPEVDENISIDLFSNDTAGIYVFTACAQPLTQCFVLSEGNEETFLSFIGEEGVDYSIFIGTSSAESFNIDIYKEVVTGVAINKIEPTQTLDVRGAIRIGENITTPYKGTLKWSANANELQGFNGQVWESVKTRKVNDLEDGLYHYDKGSIYIGDGAGTKNASNTGVFSGLNTVALGDSALYNNGFIGTLPTQGSENIAIGSRAGYSNSIGSKNSFLGFESGFHNLSGQFNNFMGASSGFHNTTGINNVFSGFQSGFSNEIGQANNLIGVNTGYSNVSGNDNNFMGYRTGFYNETGHSNVAIGSHAIFYSVNKSNIVAIGHSALLHNGQGAILISQSSNNTAVGSKAGMLNTTGAGNSFFGFEAGKNNTTGGRNTFIGNSAGYTNDDGIDNTFVGNLAGYFNDSGKENSFFGVQSGALNAGGSSNTFFGYFSGNRNTSGNNNTLLGHLAGRNNTTGNSNQFIGPGAGQSNTTASSNIAIGTGALFSNTVKTGNIAIGDSSLFTNSGTSSGIPEHSVYNTAVGFKSGYRTSIGDHNAFFGAFAGMRNEEGRNNSMFGFEAGADASYGDKNVYVGTYAGKGCTACYENTIIGYGAGSSLGGKQDNTFVGASSGLNLNGERNVSIGSSAGSATISSFENTISIGYNTRVNASNQVRIGNSSIGTIGGYAPWSDLSDGRYKFNIEENAPGLDFILGLNPITYQVDFQRLSKEEFRGDREIPEHFVEQARNKTQVRRTGFIAQEVENLVEVLDVDFDGVKKPENANDTYALSYAIFVVPLVKAVQEQQEMIEKQELINEALKIENDALRKRLERLELQFDKYIKDQ